MAFYAMRCRACGHECELEAPITQGPPEECPECQASEEDGWTQNWQEKNVSGRTYGEDHITTVGQQAEHNERKLGKELTQKMWEGERNKVRDRRSKRVSPWSKLKGASTELPVEPKTPWWRDGSVQGLPKKDKPIDARKLKTQQQVDKYIMEGKSPP